MGGWNLTAVGVVALLSAGCLEPAPDFFIRLEQNRVTFGERIRYSINDECELPRGLGETECWERHTSFDGSGPVQIRSDRACGAHFAGTGALVVEADYRGGWVSDDPGYASTPVTVAAPDAVEVGPCRIGHEGGDAVPIDMTLNLDWVMKLDGTERDGWLAENPLQTTGLELLEEDLTNRSASYRTPAEADVLMSIETVTGSVTSLLTYDPDAVDYDITLELEAPGLLEVASRAVVDVELADGVGCRFPPVDLKSLTPDQCLVDGTDVIPVVDGLCEIEVSIASYTEVFSVQVE